MRGWLHQHMQALRIALRRLVKAPLASLLSILVIGLALSLPAGLHQILGNLRLLGGRVNAEPRVTIFMALDSQPSDAATLEDTLKNDSRVASYRFIPSDEALAELKASTGLADVLATLDKNPLPNAFLVRPSDATPEALDGLKRTFEGWPKVDHVQLDSAWARKLAAFLGFGARAVLLLSIILGVALVSIIANTIRLQILAEREEIEVSKLIGATDPFIRRPFLYFGALQGLLGAAAALAFVILAIRFLNQSATDLLSLYSTDFRLRGPAPPDSAVLILTAGILGWLGAFFSVNFHLKQIRPR
jgi:cell division transport system permease protein